MRRLLVLYFSFVLVGAAEIDRAALVAEINYARRQSQVYTGLIQKWATYFRGQLLMLPGLWKTRDVRGDVRDRLGKVAPQERY